jgi:hypothetical protein
MYDRMGNADDFYKLKPKLSNKQMMLLNAFNRLSQERRLENGGPMPIKDRDIHYYQHHSGSHGCAPDLFIMAIHEVDQEYITQTCDEMRRKMNKGK